MNSNTSPDNKVLLVGHLFPDRLEKTMCNETDTPMQTQRFGLALLDALRSGFNDHVEVLSTASLLDYPHSRMVLAPSARWRIGNTINATMVPYINLTGLKHLTRFAFTLVFVGGWIFRNRGCHRIIILHGVQSCKLWGVLLGQIMGRCITVPFQTDDLAIPAKWEGAFLKKLRTVDLRIMKLGLQRVSGIIAMVSKIAEKLAPGRPSLIIPAIQNMEIKPAPPKMKNPNDRSFTIAYTGGLTQDYGINLLLDAFKQADRSNWRLVIAGQGELGNTVRDFAANHPQVQFPGFIYLEELTKLYGDADVLVNPRLTSTSLATMSFPSKIVEYLGTGRPVISTDLPAFDDRFRQHLIIARSDTPEELIRCLDEVSSWNDNQRQSWREKALKFVSDELSPRVQGDRIRDFVLHLPVQSTINTGKPL